jgi:two-component system, cell cycle sensor histidine kinase and response regulator CckA
MNNCTRIAGVPKEETMINNNAPSFLGVQGGSETILVVEDEEFVLNIAVKTLTKFGYTVLTASDGAEGLDEFEKHTDNIDLVILDLTMPKLSGEQVLERIIRSKPNAKVVICSGRNEQACSSFSCAKGYLTKPYQIADLARTVRQTLDGRLQAPA